MSDHRDHVDCLGLGIVPLDYLITIPKMPEPGGKVDAQSLCIQGGGPVPNTLVGLSRLGKTTALIAAVGDDMIGRMSIAEVEKEDVNASHMILRKRIPSDSAYGFVESGSGRRTIALCRKMSIKPRDIVTSRYPIPRIIHLDGRDIEACVMLAKWGKKVGASITFDIGSMRNDVSSIFPLVDHLIVSDAYAFGFTGKRTVKSALRSLSELCPGIVAVTEGLDGSTALFDGTFYHQPAFKVRSVDTTGAGDSFHTGYIYGLLEGFDISDRLLYGAAVAALKCTVAGAREGNPRLPELKKFLRKLPKTYA